MRKKFIYLPKMLFLFFSILFGITTISNATANTPTFTKPDKATQMKINNAYGKLPLSFIRNEGQMDEKVRFYEKGNGHSMYFTNEGVYLHLISRQEASGEKQAHTPISSIKHRQTDDRSEIRNRKSEIVKLVPLGANKTPRIIAEGLREGKINYFIGSDPEKWKTNIPTYEAVVYKEIYSGIDMKFYGNNHQMEYDIIVKPGADPSHVKLSYQNIEGLSITEEGNMEISLKACPEQERGNCKLIQNKPYVYQDIGGKRVEIEGEFIILNLPESKISNSKSEIKNQQFIYSFKVASYCKKHPLIIDPTLTLSYSTYLGGSSFDTGNGIAVDDSGNAYITGSTLSTDFPPQNPIQPSHGGGSFDVFVTKLNPAGNSLSYSTYLGGAGDDFGSGIAVDGSGNAYVTGQTSSSNFPTQNPIQADNNGGFGDVFVTKINSTGSGLIYSTYLGGSGDASPPVFGGDDGGNGIAVDGSGNAYVTGWTNSVDTPAEIGFPTTQGAYEESFQGIYDAFVTKLDPGGSLSYSTYLGGTSDENFVGGGIAVDGSGNAYVTGDTNSTDFPMTLNASQGNQERRDAFVTKLNPAGNSLIYSTYLGGNHNDIGRGIAVDGSGSAYVTGNTRSSNFPTQNPFQAALDVGAGGRDAFVTKLNPAGNSLSYSTYLGGAGIDVGNGIAIDSSGNAYVTGSTSSMGDPPTGFPTTANAFQGTNAGFGDAFVTKLNPAGNSLSYSTYLGGSSFDGGNAIAVDASGNAYVTGETDSMGDPPTGFPTTANAFQGTNAAGFGDAFVIKGFHINVSIDIKPRHCPNKLKINDDDCNSDDDSSGNNRRNRRKLTVAILGTADPDFDVRTIDVDTVRLNGVAPVKSKFKDVTAPSALEPCDCEKLPKDTYEDLVLKFNTQEIVASLGEVTDGEAVPLTLTGNLLDGTLIEGTDCVLIKIKKHGHHHNHKRHKDDDSCSSDDDSSDDHKKWKKGKKWNKHHGDDHGSGHKKWKKHKKK